MSEQQATSELTAIDPRFPASAVPSITGVRLSPGDVVELSNISRSGVLVEGRTRFVPGTRVTIHFEGGFTPAQIKGKVVRCQVSSISGGALRYQSGIQFDKRLDSNPSEGTAIDRNPASAGAVAVAAAAATTTSTSTAKVRKLANRW
jgi:hypothetical protein